MLRRTSVLVGLAVLLSLLFPVKALLAQGGVDPLALRPPGMDLAAACALVALLPSFALFRHGRLQERIARWNAWMALLALFSIAFVLLHVNWTHDFAAAYVREAIAPGGPLPLAIRSAWVMDVAELASRLGVLVCVLGVLVNLQQVPDTEAAPPKRRRK